MTSIDKKIPFESRNCVEDFPIQSNCPIENLPIEVAVMVLKNLTLSDASHLAQTSQHFNNILAEGAYWNLKAEQLGRLANSPGSSRDCVKTIVERVQTLAHQEIFEGFEAEGQVFIDKTPFQKAIELSKSAQGNLLALLVPQALPGVEVPKEVPFPKLQGQALSQFLTSAVQRKSLEDIRLAVRCGVALCESTLSYLNDSQDPLAAIQSLVVSGLDLNAVTSSGTPLVDSAIRNGYERCAGALIDAGCEVGTKHFWLATLFKRPDTILKLSQRDGDINGIHNGGWTPLITALTTTPSLVPLLIHCGAKVTTHGSRGQPLDYAIEGNRSDFLSLLIQEGADIEELNPFYHMRPLQNAARNRRVECLKILLTLGASVNSVDEDGRTAVWHIAHRERGTATQGSPQDDITCLNVLASYHADLNLADSEGYSPLFTAARCYNYPALRALLKMGADPKQRNQDGQTPLEYLRGLARTERSEPFRKCLRLLEKARSPSKKLREFFGGKD